MDTNILLAFALFAAILVPFLVFEIRRGKRTGRSLWTRCKPQGHGDTGPDTGRGPGGRPSAALDRSDECTPEPRVGDHR